MVDTVDAGTILNSKDSSGERGEREEDGREERKRKRKSEGSIIVSALLVCMCVCVNVCWMIHVRGPT